MTKKFTTWKENTRYVYLRNIWWNKTCKIGSELRLMVNGK